MRDRWGLLNGEWQVVGTATLPLGSEGAQFGVGVFSTLGVWAGKVVALARHAARLRRDAESIGLRSVPEEGLAKRCAEVVTRNGMAEAGLKVIWWADGERVIEWIQPRENPYSVPGVTAGRRLQLRDCVPRRGRAWSSAKTINYGEHWQALREARASGWDDALWIDSGGALLETATANFYLLREGRCFTPPLSEGVLPGVVREHLLQGGYGVEEASLPREWLADADAAFVTNSLAGVLPVVQVGDRSYGPRLHPWVQALQEKVRGRLMAE